MSLHGIFKVILLFIGIVSLLVLGLDFLTPDTFIESNTINEWTKLCSGMLTIFGFVGFSIVGQYTKRHQAIVDDDKEEEQRVLPSKHPDLVELQKHWQYINTNYFYNLESQVNARVLRDDFLQQFLVTYLDKVHFEDIEDPNLRELLARHYEIVSDYLIELLQTLAPPNYRQDTNLLIPHYKNKPSGILYNYDKLQEYQRRYEEVMKEYDRVKNVHSELINELDRLGLLKLLKEKNEKLHLLKLLMRKLGFK